MRRATALAAIRVAALTTALFTALSAALSAALFAALPTVAASAAPAAKCVGLVVDSGQGSTKTGCVPYQSGITGADLLKKTGHKVGYESNGLLCQIDGYPKECKTDNTHYWSYYIRPAGKTSWTYANKGPTTQKAQAGEIEAFVYQNGKSRKPGAISYATLAKAHATSTSASSTKSDSGGSNTGLIVGIVVAVVIVLAAAGTFVMRRRRAA